MKFTRSKKVPRDRFYWAVWHPKGEPMDPSTLNHPQPVYVDFDGKIYHNVCPDDVECQDTAGWLVGDQIEEPPYDAACPDFEEDDQ
jgi:hypothetical protein